MSAKRLYVVTEIRDEVVSERLVNATNPSAAVNYVVRGTFTAASAKSADVARLMKSGVVVQEAGDE